MLFYAGLVSCCSLQQVGADGGRSRPCGGDGRLGRSHRYYPGWATYSRGL